MVRDKYPATSAKIPTAVVNIESILETANHELLQVGSWLNIVGYVRSAPVVEFLPSKSSIDVGRQGESGSLVQVDATLVWSAGAIRLDQYKLATREYASLRSRH